MGEIENLKVSVGVIAVVVWIQELISRIELFVSHRVWWWLGKREAREVRMYQVQELRRHWACLDVGLSDFVRRKSAPSRGSCKR